MISIICPVYNESNYIEKVLDFCISATPHEKEIIIIDGNSSDDTCAIIKNYIQTYPQITLLHNSKRYVPNALNTAIQQSKGDILIRLDAHTEYAEDYFDKILEVFNKTNADIVGGPMRIAKGSNVQDAIGYVTSTFFGIGNSSFHFENFEGYTDSVYLGAWKKNIFSITGGFDEKFIRNQDDEFHYRAKSLGLKIFQSPQIKVYYHPRKTFSALFKQYYQYGLYKPLVLKKIKSVFRWRHLVPPLFIIYLLSLPVFFINGFTQIILPLIAYLTANIFYASLSKKKPLQILRISFAYLIIHIAYGSGFLAGSIKMLFK